MRDESGRATAPHPSCLVPHAAVSAAVRVLAEDGNAYRQPFPGETRIVGRRFVLSMADMPGASFNQVCRVRLSAGEVEAAVAEVRELLAAANRQGNCEWEVGSSATPADLAERLRALGIVPQPEQPAAAAVALAQPPRLTVRPRVVARRAASPMEEVAATEIRARCFGGEAPWSEERRQTLAAEIATAPPSPGNVTYLAWLDGEPVAAANALFCRAGVILAGGATLPEARGQGAYGALVAARWEDARARGTPALVAHAGSMSRPILERIGFVPVAEMHFLIDPGKS